jgi:PTH1 family peptidyl-tRNA hydrolase
MGWLRRDRSVSTLDLLVAGLGNPGREYAHNRHNVGFMVVEELARRHDARFRTKFHGRLAELRLERNRLALLEPETFMNESGRSLVAAAHYFKLEPEHLLVVHDDVDLEPGRLQLRMGGGLAGHNGLRSIATALATKEFLRLRVGVGRPGHGDRRSVADFVLSNFDPETDVAEIVSRAADAAELLAGEGLDTAQARFNS